MFDKWGHLSQILWKGTTHIACVTKDCTAQGLGGPTGGSAPHFTVCNYKSAGKKSAPFTRPLNFESLTPTLSSGNVAGGYAKNVLPPNGAPFFGVTR